MSFCDTINKNTQSREHETAGFFMNFADGRTEINMKKIFMTILAALMLTANITALAEGNSPSVYLNGTKMTFETEPFIDEASERTLVPMRDIFDAVGAVVQWDETTKTVIAVKGNSFVTLQIGSPKAFINSESHTLDVNAVIKDDKTFVPLRFVSEALGAEIEWDNDNYAVKINIAE